MENFTDQIDKVFAKSAKQWKEESLSFRQRNTHIKDRLLEERQKALTTLQNNPIPRGNKNYTKNSENKENNFIAEISNQSDYIAMPPPSKTINISDLVKDETINLQLSSNSTPTAQATNIYKQRKKSLYNKEDNNISFEINEITGRSTLYNLESKYAGASSRLSVSDILATSCAPKVRSLRNSLVHSGINTTTNSTMTSFNDMQSLPRTADMSSITNFERNENEPNDTASSWSVAGVPLSFSFTKNLHTNNNAFETNESFAPAELMQSKLLNDEISWAQERATIPSVALSKEAKAKINANETNTMIDNSNNTASDNLMFNEDDPNFSLGRFFNMRSENLSSIVNHRSPDKEQHDPVALVDETTLEQPLAVTSSTSLLVSPLKANRNSKLSSCGGVAHGQNSKDSGNATTDSSYFLSVSEVDRALNNLNMNSDETDRNLFEKLFKIKISPKNNKNKNTTINKNNQTLEVQQKTLTEEATITKFCNFISSNKENVDPLVLRNNVPISMHDTQSFSESMLNTTNLNKLNNTTLTSKHSRSPLSPLALESLPNHKNEHTNDNNNNDDIKINIPKIEIVSETGIEGDLDEWPSSLIVPTLHRRVLRKKSPSPSPHTSPIERKTKAIMNDDYSPAKHQVSPSLSENRTTPTTSLTNTTRASLVAKSKQPGLCSTRLETVTTINDTDQNCYDKCTTPTNSHYGNSPNLKVTTLLQKNGNSSNNNNKNGNDSPGSIISGGGVGLTASRTTCSCGSPRNERMTLAAPTRSVSRCSSTSEFTHRVGKIVPIKVTTLELSWPSTKLRTTIRKSMQVKNIADKRLALRIEIIGPGFQILNMPTSNLLTLQPQECRSIKINFCPTVTGIANGILAFYTANSNNHHHQPQNIMPFLEIPLNAYGGHSRLVPQNICKGPVGPHYINMGNICDVTQPLERTFQLYNTGSLCGFFSIAIDTVGLQFRGLNNAFSVSPQRSLIHSGSFITVRITFQPRRDDIRKIAKRLTNVMTLAQLRVISGDEANRQRMRRLFRMMPSHERSKLNVQLSDELWSVWPDEKNLDDELKNLQEAPDAIMDLINYMKVHEIALTITNDDNLDDSAAAVETSSLYYPDVDETVLFRTVCAAQQPAADVSNIDTVTSTTPNMVEIDDGEGGTCAGAADDVGTWYVTPNILKFDFFAEKRKNKHISMFVHNSYKSRQYFEIICNQKHLLYCTPSEGYIAPDGGYMEIVINSNYQTPPAKMLQEPIFMTVYMENEHITVPVEIPDDNYL